MKKLLAFVSLTTLLLTGQALAQVDPDVDMIGIYFDPEAATWCVNPGAVGPVDAYLCLTSASADSGVAGWECTIEVTEGVFVLEWNLQGIGASNFSTEPEFIVGMSEPLPRDDVIVLMQFTVGAFLADPIDLRVLPIANPSLPPDPWPLPTYADGDNSNILIPMGYAGGWDQLTGDPYVCAQINGGCDVIPSEDATWGGVKSLYR